MSDTTKKEVLFKVWKEYTIYTDGTTEGFGEDRLLSISNNHAIIVDELLAAQRLSLKGIASAALLPATKSTSDSAGGEQITPPEGEIICSEIRTAPGENQ